MAENERVFEECKHGTWLSPCPICKAENEPIIKFTKDHFIRISLDNYHYYYSFGVPGFEICLEPCAAGFNVAVYADDIDMHPEEEPKPADHLTAYSGIRKVPTDDLRLIEPKRCTKTGDYTQIDALFGDRSDEDWNKALEIADELFDKYMKDREKLGALLSHLQKEKMKCMFCGCTADNACPDGCSWIAPNLCSKCADRAKGNDLISGEEIIAVRYRAKTITMKEALRVTMVGGYVPIIPMVIKSGYGVSLTIVEDPQSRKIELLSVGSQRGNPDPADSELIALAVLGPGYLPLEISLSSKRMVHFMKNMER